MKWEIIQGDITQLEVDAIVNAANKTLLGGGGVDGAIHRAAGPELKEACRKLGGAETGEAKLTPGFNLPADYVIHTVGPIYQEGKQGEADLLKACYENSLQVARENTIKTVAFPSISTGAYRYPMEEAAEIAIQTVVDQTKNQEDITHIIFSVFDAETEAVYKKQLKKLTDKEELE